MMRIVHIRWTVYRIPLRSSFVTAHGSVTMREGAIVELFTSRDNVVGVGEIAPLPEFGGDLEGALAVLPLMANELHGKTLAEALAYLQIMLFSGNLPAATACGLEIALLDALGKAWDCSISRLLNSEQSSMPRQLSAEDNRSVGAADDGVEAMGPLRQTMPLPRMGISVNAVIGSQEVAVVVQQARRLVAAGFSCLKIKLGNDPQNEIECIKAVREAIGPSIQLRLDANEGWTFEQALTILTACIDWHIQYVEQPLPAYDINGMCELQRAVAVPLAADEAVRDLASVRLLLQARAAQVLIIKPQVAGGLGASKEILRLARQAGVQCVVTSAFETGIGLAAILHLAAASPEITWACGLATLDRLVDDLLCEDLPVHKGIMAVPTGDGLGVNLDRKALLQYRYALGEG